MKLNKKYLLVVVLFLYAAVGGYSQTVKSSYFLDKSPLRLALNPAFMPEMGYVNIPIIGGIGVNVYSNSLSIDNLLFPRNGELVTFLDPSVSSKEFMSGLTENNSLSFDLDLTILGFGFHTKNSGFLSFDVGLVSTSNMNVSKNLFGFMKNGISESGVVHDVGRMGFYNETYVDVTARYSHKINDQITVGLAAKFLVGVGNIDMQIDQINIHSSYEQLKVETKGMLNSNIGGLSFEQITDSQGTRLDINNPKFDSGGFGVGGFGFAVDFGATYRPLDQLLVSVAVTDLGFITWRKSGNTTAVADGLFDYDGFDFPMQDGDVSIDDQFEVLKDEIGELIHFEQQDSRANTQMITAKFNVGAEYSILNNKIGFGLLYWGRILPESFEQELMVLANFRPLNWFSASLSYGFLNRQFDTFGLVLNFSPSWINFFIGTDYMITKVTPQFIPVSRSMVNFYLGMSIPLRRNRAAVDSKVSHVIYH